MSYRSSASSTGTASYHEFMGNSEPHSPRGSFSAASGQSTISPSRSTHDATGGRVAPGAGKKALQRKMTPQQIRGALLRSSPTLTGYIKKRGGISFGLDKLKSWKDRYFVLHGGTLAYYRHEKEAANASRDREEHDFNDCRVAFSGKFPGFSSPLPAPKAYLSLEGARIHRVKIEHSKLSTDGILLVTARQSEVLAFGSPSDRDSWYSAIMGVMQAMQDYNPRGFPVLPQPPPPKALPWYLIPEEGESLQASPIKHTAMGSSPSSTSLADSYYDDNVGSVGRRSIDSSHTGQDSVPATVAEHGEDSEY
eukprot:gb/GECG01005020.1/.p1 GENE.gb/GECG01005020.1/~~gb/GECG01005020.1/.p1  ORF type:complete len:308 (+),score=33.57 gb/GECG01005020.1/:1-924(+)